MVQGRNYGPQVTVSRLSATRKSASAAEPIFMQVARQVVKMKASDLRLPSRAWKVSQLQIIFTLVPYSANPKYRTKNDGFYAGEVGRRGC